MILQSVNQPAGIDAVFSHLLQYQTQKLCVSGEQRMVVGGPGHEVVGKVGTALRHLPHVLERQSQLLKGKAAELAHHVSNELVGRHRERMPFRPDPSALIALDTEE